MTPEETPAFFMNYDQSILIIDANNISLRAAHGSPDLRDREGYPTAVMMTTVRSIVIAAEIIRPARIVCVWDGGHSKFRKKLFPGYKDRGDLDPESEKGRLLEDWKWQREQMIEIFPTLGIGQIRIEGVEADDAIYKMVGEFSAADIPTVIVSTDADFMQMVNENFCAVYNPAKHEVYETNDDVLQRFGVSVRQFVDYRAIIGDKSDKIDGVPKVGEKTAVKIIAQFLRLNEFYRQATPEFLESKEAKPYHRALVEHRETVERNKKLIWLGALPADEIPADEFAGQLDEAISCVPDHNAFWQFCMKHQLMKLLETRPSWGLLCRG